MTGLNALNRVSSEKRFDQEDACMGVQAIAAPKEVNKRVFATKAFVRLGKLGESGASVLKHALEEKDLASELA